MDIKRTVLSALDFYAESFANDPEEDPTEKISNGEIATEAREAYRMIETGRVTLLRSRGEQ